MHLVGTHPVGELGERRDPRFRDHRSVTGVLVEDETPLPVDVVHTFSRPEWRHFDLCVDIRFGCSAAHAAQIGRRRVIRETVFFDHSVGHIHSETVDAAIEPEAQDVAELRAHPGVGPIEVGLGAVENVEVPLAWSAVGVGDAGPGGATENRMPVVRRDLAVLTFTVAEDVAPALVTAFGRRECLPEPPVLT